MEHIYLDDWWSGSNISQWNHPPIAQMLWGEASQLRKISRTSMFQKSKISKNLKNFLPIYSKSPSWKPTVLQLFFAWWFGGSVSLRITYHLVVGLPRAIFPNGITRRPPRCCEAKPCNFEIFPQHRCCGISKSQKISKIFYQFIQNITHEREQF